MHREKRVVALGLEIDFLENRAQLLGQFVRRSPPLRFPTLMGLRGLLQPQTFPHQSICFRLVCLSLRDLRIDHFGRTHFARQRSRSLCFHHFGLELQGRWMEIQR